MLYQTSNPHGGDIYGDPVILDFSANTNPFGTPQGVLDAVEAALPSLHRYPDPYCRELIAAISEFEQIPKEFILCGNGAADLIYAYARALHPERSLELAPTFSEYSLGLSQAGCEVFRYSLKQSAGFLPEDDFFSCLEGTSPQVVYLCNPNNPTGKLLKQEFLKKVLDYCKDKKIRLFLDECFLDLTENGVSMKPFLREYPNLFILKAFTKSYGMAGIRLGYGFSADADLLEKMSRSCQPWNVSTLAQAAGIAALKEQDFLHRTVETISCERVWLQQQLEQLGFWVCPSETNFILFRGPVQLGSALRKQGIAIRSCDNYEGLGPGWFRTAVRLHDENKKLIGAIADLAERTDSWQKTL